MPTQETKKDAVHRTSRSAVQNALGVAATLALIAASSVVLDQVEAGQVLDLSTLGPAVAVAVIGTVSAYVHRVVTGKALDKE